MMAHGIPVLSLYKDTEHIVCDPGPRTISTSNDAVNLLKPVYAACMELHEEVHALLLNRSCRVIGVHKVSQGGINGSVCDPRLILCSALLAGASRIVVSHNHPSGALRPSTEDISITKKLINAANSMDISITDHVIISKEGYFSFADNGML